MAFSVPVTSSHSHSPYFHRCRASNETIFPSSSLKPLRIPRLGPLFWPWEKVKIGPLTVSPMGFGTWAWGNQVLWGYEEKIDGELQATFNVAVESGINLFDTADSYGTGKLNGQSEKLLGKFISEFQGDKRVRDGIVVATKFAAYPWRLTPKQFVNACESSLDRIGIEKIGIGQLHWSTANYAPLQEKALWDGLVAMYEKGLVEAVGVSNYGPKQLVKVHDYLKTRGVPLCSAQVQFSLLSLGDDQLEVKQVCDSLGIRLISYSPLGLGMLTGKYTPSNLPSGPRALLFRKILPGLEPLLASLKGIAQRRNKTIPQVRCRRYGDVSASKPIHTLHRLTLASRANPQSWDLLKVSILRYGFGRVKTPLHSSFFQKILSLMDAGELCMSVAINWCICKGTIPIPGVKTIKQAKENLGALGWRLNSKEILELEYAARESPRKMIQNIFQTK